MTTIRCFMLAPTVAFAARVNMGSITYPLDSLTYDGVTTGVYSGIFAGMTLLLGSSAGADDLGRQRVRASSTSTVIPVGRSSRGTRDGELDVADNAYITVLWDMRVWAKIPYINPANGNIYKDSDIAPSGHVADPVPVANGGPGFCATIDSTTSLITVTFDGSNSFQFDPAVSSALSGITDYLWDVGDGTITSGTITSSSLTVTFPAGFRYVLLTVISGAGKSHQCYIPVFARNPASDASVAVQVVNYHVTPHGREVSIRILDNVPRSTYPDGTLVMLWDREPTGPTDRNHMYFIGWHQSDSAGTRRELTGSLRDTVLNCVDVAGRLKTLPGFPQVLNKSTSPVSWSGTRYPNVFYYFWYLLYWHSTALEVADLLLGTQILNNFAFYILGSDAASLYDQVNHLANNVTPDHHLGCTAGGQLILTVDSIIQHVADRSATLLDTWTEDDWTEVRFTYQRPPRVYKQLSYAVESDDSAYTALASIAPGLAEGQGATNIETSERIAASQSALNNVEGNRYARANARFGYCTIVLPYDRIADSFDVAYQGWVALYLTTPNIPQRGGVFSGDRGIVQDMVITHDYQPTGVTRLATMQWEQETSGPAAVTYVPVGSEGG